MPLRDKKSDNVLDSDRARQVLAVIIREYMNSAKPVGSRSIAKLFDFDLSPATIRNVMADLEEMGYLSQPHTSAGRLPTGKAFRYYVDSILNVTGLTRRERDRIKRRYHPEKLDMTQTLKQTCRILSATSNCLALAMTPKISHMRFKHIQFVRLASFEVLGVFVTNSGMIQNVRLETAEDFSQDYLDKITRYLSPMLSGLTLVEVRDRILVEMKRERVTYDRFMARALKLGEMAFVDMDDRELFMEGKVRIFDAPEFSTIQRMKAFLEALEEKGFLLKLLDQSLKSPGVRIIIGSEFDHQEMAECSLVTATYGTPAPPQGTLGVIGPMRMNYSRVISLVDYTAGLLTQRIGSAFS
jgi:heat-inducible transcriptional repressor